MGQQNLPGIKDKVLRSIMCYDSEFYLVTSKDYDRDIDILHTQSQDFNASIVRAIEPGLLEICDIMMKFCVLISFGARSHSCFQPCCLFVKMLKIMRL